MKWTSILVLLLVLGSLSYVALRIQPEEKKVIGKGTGLMEDWSEEDLRLVNEIHLKQGDKHFEFLKDIQGLWRMRRPEFVLANMLKVQQIFFACCQPEVERELKMDDRYLKNIKEHGVEIEIKNKHKSVKLDFFRLVTHPKVDFIRYHHRPDLVYKVNRRIDFDIYLNADNFRTKRIFPFGLKHVKKMEYRNRGKVVTFTKKGKQFSFDRRYVPQFANVLNEMRWMRAGGVEFVRNAPKGKPYATYFFEFESGQSSTLHLYMNQDSVLYYEGRKLGMRIDEKTLLTYFPEL